MRNDEDKKGLISIRSGGLARERQRLIRRGLDALVLSGQKEWAGKDHDIPESNFVEIADNLIERGDHAEAEKVLRKGIAAMPFNWKPIIDSDRLEIAFWNMSEFEAYVEHQRSLGADRKSFFWTYPSYSKAHFLLSYLAVERGDLDEALKEVNKGLALESDHPKMLGEKGFILRSLGRFGEALEAYKEAATARSSWFPITSRGEALRGRGFCLMDLGRLNEAESALKESLMIDPNNSAAINALNHLAELRATEDREGNELPRSESHVAHLLNSMVQHIDDVEEQANNDEQWRSARANDPFYQNTTFEERKENQLSAFEAYLREGKEGIRKHLDRMRAKKQNRSTRSTEDDVD